MSDFFEEVDENLRVSQLQTLSRRAWPYALGAAVVALAIALGVWAWSSRQTGEAGRASELYAAGLQAAQSGDLKTAEAKFAAAAKGGSKGYRILALMQEAGLALARDKAADALAKLDAAASSAPDVLMGDLARLKAAYLVMDKAPYASVETRLKPLTAAGRPYRGLAMEALAMAQLQSGRLNDARGTFTVLTLSEDAGELTRQRARAALAMIDAGTAKQLPALVKAAPAAPVLSTPPAAPAAGAE